MPDNRAIEIYRKDREEPIKALVRSIEKVHRSTNGMPYQIDFKEADGRPGTIFVNADEIETVIIAPAGIRDTE